MACGSTARLFVSRLTYFPVVQAQRCDSGTADPWRCKHYHLPQRNTGTCVGRCSRTGTAAGTGTAACMAGYRTALEYAAAGTACQVSKGADQQPAACSPSYFESQCTGRTGYCVPAGIGSAGYLCFGKICLFCSGHTIKSGVCRQSRQKTGIVFLENQSEPSDHPGRNRPIFVCF